MKYLIFILAVASLLIFNCTNISPNQFLYAGIITFLIPFALLFNGVAFCVLFYKKRYLSLVPLVVLLVGFKYLLATFAINLPAKAEGNNTFSVLSYNTSFFAKGDLDEKITTAFDKESATYKMLQWVVNNDADIKCFQEFYHRDSTKMLATLDIISEDGEYDYYFSSKEVSWEDAEVGIVIFSRFPIIDSGEVNFSKGSVNRAAFADIKIHNDTVRVINVHLQSMNLKPNNPLDSESLSKKKEDIKTIYRKFTRGQIDRSYQAEVIKELIMESPYKTILVGDFNQTPYSFVYHSFKQLMHNAFEKAGNGFGFTYSGNTLFFLRIDNQFYDRKLRILDFKTYNELPYSDHYPIEAVYAIPEDK